MSFIEKFTENGQMIASKIQANRYMKSISEGLMALLPVMMVGAFSVLLSAMQWQPYQEAIAPIKHIIALPASFTNNVLALYAVFSIAYRLAKTFDIDGLIPGFIGLFSFLVITPIAKFAVEGSDFPVSALAFDWLGAKGLFAAMIVGLVASRMYVFFVNRNLTIKMPDGVPPTIAKTFAGLLPAILVCVFFTVVSALFTLTSFGNMHQFVYTLIQIPLQNLGGSIYSLLIALFLMQLLWVFGIHGAIVVMAIIRPIITALDLENLAAYQAGLEIPNVVSGGLWSIYANFAPMLGLVLVLLLFSKSKQFKTIGKLGAPGAIFGIHEPLIFGLPIVMNPILAIPYILSPIVCVAIGYILTIIKVLPVPIGMQVPFGAPIFISGLLQGSWVLGVAQILLIFVSAAIYYPFVKILDKRNMEETNKE